MERGGWKQKWGDGEAWIALKSTAEKHLLRHLSAKNESTTEAQRRGGKCKNPLKNAGSRFLQCSKLYWEQQGSCLSPLVPGRQGLGRPSVTAGQLGGLFVSADPREFGWFVHSENMGRGTATYEAETDSLNPTLRPFPEMGIWKDEVSRFPSEKWEKWLPIFNQQPSSTQVRFFFFSLKHPLAAFLKTRWSLVVVKKT